VEVGRLPSLGENRNEVRPGSTRSPGNQSRTAQGYLSSSSSWSSSQAAVSSETSVQPIMWVVEVVIEKGMSQSLMNDESVRKQATNHPMNDRTREILLIFGNVSDSCVIRV
jgi:hypothetical protein